MFGCYILANEGRNHISVTGSLTRAAADGELDLVKTLLGEGADPNQLTGAGQTPLILAAVSGHEQIVRVLLAAGALVQVKDNLGLTALEWSVRRGFSNITQLIANASAQGLAAQTKANTNAVRVVPSPPTHSEAPALTASDEHAAEPKVNQDALEQGLKPDTPKAGLGSAAGAIRRTQAAQANSDEKGLPEEAAITGASLEISAEETSAEKSATGPNTTRSSQKLEQALAEIERERPRKPGTLSDRIREKGRRRVEEEEISRQEEPAFIAELVTEQEGLLHPDITASPGPGAASPALNEAPSELNPLITPPTTVVPTPVAGPIIKESIDSSNLKVPGFDLLSSHSSARPILWLLVLVTLGVSAFVAYRLSNHSVGNEQPRAAGSISTVTQPATGAVAKSLPVVAGELSGAELSLPNAEYPATSKSDAVRTSSTVMVLVRMNRKGEVTSARALYGDKELRAAAVAAARKATFSPEKLIQKGRAMSGTITYNFVPPGSNSSANPTARETSVSDQTANAIGTDSPVVGGPLLGAEINLPRPEYHEAVRSHHVPGKITVVVRVNRAGKVISWLTLDGDPQLRAAALRAARKATFSPQKLPGKGEVVGTITYNFKP